MILLLPFQKQGDKIRIGNDITITIARVEPRGRVRLAIAAPEHVPIARLEVYNQDHKPRRDQCQRDQCQT